MIDAYLINDNWSILSTGILDLGDGAWGGVSWSSPDGSVATVRRTRRPWSTSGRYTDGWCSAGGRIRACAWKVNANLTLTFLASSDETASPNTGGLGRMPSGMISLSANGSTPAPQRRCFDTDAYDLSAATGSRGNIVHISAHQLVIMAIFHQEGIVSMAGGDFCIADIQLVIQQRPDNSAGALWRKTPVSSK